VSGSPPEGDGSPSRDRPFGFFHAASAGSLKWIKVKQPDYRVEELGGKPDEKS
jgi:hypothetical protein